MRNFNRNLTNLERFAVARCNTPDDLDELARLIKGEEGLYPSRAQVTRVVKRHRRPKHMRYTNAQKRKAVELYRQGKSVKAIERLTGVRANTVYTFVGGFGFRRPHKKVPIEKLIPKSMFNRKYTKEKVEEALDMYSRGDDVKEIAKLVGMNWKTVYSYAHARGIKRGITEKDREHDAKLEVKMGITGRRETKMPRKELKELVESYWGAGKTWDYKDLVERFGCTPNAASVAINQLKKEWSFMQNFTEIKVALDGTTKRTRFIPKAEKAAIEG